MLEKIQGKLRSAMQSIFAFTPKKISAIIVVIFVAAFFLQLTGDIVPWMNRAPIFSQLEWVKNLDYDIHLTRKLHKPMNPQVVVVEVNERTLQALGRWPFSRAVYAKLIQNLEAASARAVGFDIVFSEAEQEQALRLMTPLVAMAPVNTALRQELENRIHSMDGDGALLQVLQRTKMAVALGFVGEALVSKEHLGSSGLEVSSTQKSLMDKIGFVRKRNLGEEEPKDALWLSSPVILPTDRLSSGILLNPLNNISLGIFNSNMDNDGVVRTAPVISKFKNNIYGSLSLNTIAAALQERPVITKKRITGELLVQFDEHGLVVPVQARGNINVNYYGRGRDFPFVELIDVLENKEGKFGANLFKDKIVYVGVTAQGLKDLRTTPMNPDYPGVEVHATLTSNILNQDFLLKTEDYYIVGFALLSVFAFFLSVLQFRLHPSYGFAITAFVIAAIQIGGQKLFFDKGLVVPTLLPSIQVFCIFMSAVFYRFLSAEKDKKYVRTAFARYVSGAVVEEMLKDQKNLKLGGQKKKLTVLFTDMVGFTKLSETLDAQKLSSLLNQFFTEMTQIILDNGGTVDKYMGDAIMCFWGAPLDVPNHAEMACKAAVEMQACLKRINERWQKEYGFTVGMRIGINTGDMSVGNMGSDQIFSYTVLGDNVNLGSRLESVNNVYGTWVIVSESARQAVQEKFFFRELDEVAVKGKEQAVTIYELIGTNPQPQNILDWAHAYEYARTLYKVQDWAAAKKAFTLCLTMNASDKASQIFIERITDLEQQALPKDWDGVWKLTAK